MILYTLISAMVGCLDAATLKQSVVMAADANRVFHYYDRVFGMDLSGTPYFQPVTSADVKAFATLVGRPKFVMRYGFFATSQWLDFAEMDISGLHPVTIPSMFVLNEVNKLILESAKPNYPWKMMALSGHPTPSAEKLSEWQAEREFIFRRVRSIGDYIFNPKPEWVASIGLIMQVQRIMLSRGVFENNVDTKVLFNSMFTALCLLFREEHPVYFQVIELLYMVAENTSWTRPDVKEGVDELFRILQFAAAGFTAPGEPTLLERIPDVLQSIMTGHAVIVRFYSTNNSISRFDNLKTALNLLNSYVINIDTWMTKPVSWYAHHKEVVIVDKLKGYSNVEIYDNLKPKIMTELTALGRDPSGHIGKVANAYMSLAAEWSQRSFLSGIPVPTMTELLMLVHANKILNKLFGLMQAARIPHRPIQTGLLKSASRQINAIRHMTGNNYQGVVMGLNLCAPQVFKAYHAVWTLQDPVNRVIAEIQHTMFELILSHHINWDIWIFSDALSIMSTFENLLEAIADNLLPAEAYSDMEQMQSGMQRALDESYYRQPEGRISKQLFAWKSSARYLLARVQGIDHS